MDIGCQKKIQNTFSSSPSTQVTAVSLPWKEIIEAKKLHFMAAECKCLGGWSTDGAKIN